MGWRPVPGYEPSAEAYEPAVVVLERGRGVLSQLQTLGLFHPDVDADELMRVWTILITGVITQQLANAPQECFEEGTFTALLPQLVEMYRVHYAPERRTAPQRRGRHADQR